MKINEVIKRIKYLKSELAHEGYHDGWTLEGMKKELKELEEFLQKDE